MSRNVKKLWSAKEFVIIAILESSPTGFIPTKDGYLWDVCIYLSSFAVI